MILSLAQQNCNCTKRNKAHEETHKVIHDMAYEERHENTDRDT